MPKDKYKTFYERTYELNFRSHWPQVHNNIFFTNGLLDKSCNSFKPILELIDQDGKIIDLGCGNGLLLKYLVDHSQYILVPIGIDFIAASIKQGLELVFPSNKNVLFHKNIVDYDFKQGPFSFILTSPSYLHIDHLDKFLLKCFKNLKKGGKIILQLFSDNQKPYLSKKHLAIYKKHGFQEYNNPHTNNLIMYSIKR
ncbi:class I SAM-dependent methyltransferase [Candidatus Margulisiibacteriota bacterium]